MVKSAQHKGIVMVLHESVLLSKAGRAVVVMASARAAKTLGNCIVSVGSRMRSLSFWVWWLLMFDILSPDAGTGLIYVSVTLAGRPPRTSFSLTSHL